MKTFEEILKAKYLHPLSKLEKEWIYSAMREACEQAIDKCNEATRLSEDTFDALNRIEMVRKMLR